MKSTKIIYWACTGIFSALMLFSGYMYITAPDMKSAFMHLGFPDYFRYELATAKIIGAIVLMIPALNGRIKEWAYAGFSITLVSAVIAHVSSGDPAGRFMAPIIVSIFLIVSYVCYHRLYSSDSRVLHAEA